MRNRTHNPCSGYRPEVGPGVCCHGFFQTQGCYTKASAVPWCMRDDIPEHWLDEKGAPIFYRNIQQKGEDYDG